MPLNKDKALKFARKLIEARRKPKDRSALIQQASPQDIRALLNIGYNYVTGKRKLKRRYREKVERHSPKIKKFVYSCLSHTRGKKRKGAVHCKAEGVQKARKLLVNQRGGFFPALIPLIIGLVSAAAPIAAKAALVGAATAGAAAVVNKIVQTVKKTK